MWLACSSWGYPRGKPDRDPSQPRQLEAESRPKMIVKDDRFNFASDALRSAFAVVLKFRSAESEHVIRSDRSSWSCYAWRFDIISSKTFVSSAKATIRLDWTASGREFTYRTNNMEPRIQPAVGSVMSQVRGSLPGIDCAVTILAMLTGPPKKTILT